MVRGRRVCRTPAVLQPVCHRRPARDHVNAVSALCELARKRARDPDAAPDSAVAEGRPSSDRPGSVAILFARSVRSARDTSGWASSRRSSCSSSSTISRAGPRATIEALRVTFPRPPLRRCRSPFRIPSAPPRPVATLEDRDLPLADHIYLACWIALGGDHGPLLDKTLRCDLGQRRQLRIGQRAKSSVPFMNSILSARRTAGARGGSRTAGRGPAPRRAAGDRASNRSRHRCHAHSRQRSARRASGPRPDQRKPEADGSADPIRQVPARSPTQPSKSSSPIWLGTWKRECWGARKRTRAPSSVTRSWGSL